MFEYAHYLIIDYSQKPPRRRKKRPCGNGAIYFPHIKSQRLYLTLASDLNLNLYTLLRIAQLSLLELQYIILNMAARDNIGCIPR